VLPIRADRLFENLWPKAAPNVLTATQAIYNS